MFKKVICICVFIFGSFCLFVINLFCRVRVVQLISSRIGHLVINTESFFRNAKEKNTRYLVLSPIPIANMFLFKKWKECLPRSIFVRYDEHPILARVLQVLLKMNSRYCDELPFFGNDALFWKKTTSCFYFTEDERLQGEEILKKMGIYANEWYVCVFARDSAYLNQEFSHDGKTKKDWRYHDYRDSDIDTLNLAIQEILNRGGWVIRLGKIVAKEMSFKHPKVIDYPFSKWRSDFMDIYLQYRAKFVLSSSTSGATDVVVLFNTPYCGVNMPYNWRGGYANMIQIPKKYKKNGKYLSLHEWIKISKEDKSYSESTFYTRHGLEIIDNSPQEILDLTKEMFDRLDGTFEPNLEEEKKQDRYECIYREYTEFEKCRGHIGKKFLHNNPWYLE